ncbi:discoidin domain-containing protein [Occultella kanbiaonis]|uniref:discoidin domain-containing protein n=1 Tax=Occultella kanbiaonis TaxID=2675754 RepID=UPI0013D834D9|nr:discoidin domain-containing protein [Occultella kanbiaonis]
MALHTRTRRGLAVVLGAVLTFGLAVTPQPAHAADIDIFDVDPNLPDGLVNLAEGKPAASSSSYEMSNEGWATSFVNDGRIGTATLPYGWTTNPIGNTATATTPAWVQLDLLAESTIAGVALWPRMDGASDGQNFPVDYQVQVSDDASTWSTVATSTANTAVGDAQVLELDAAEGRYIRVLATRRAEPTGRDGYLVQLAEFAVYGTSSGVLVELDKPALELLPGDADQLTPRRNGVPTDPGAFTWTSADPSVAGVDAAGLVTGVALGSTTVSATGDGGATVTIPVTVIAERVDTDAEFMISAFWPPTAQHTTAEQYDYLADAGVDYVQNVDSTDLQGRAINLQMATLAAERGMLVGVSDPRLNESLSLTDQEIRDIVAEYENVPGVGGFYLRDEPYNANAYGRVHQAVKDEADWLYPYLNFLPMFAYPDRATYQSQVDDFAELALTDELDYLMYDRYPFGDAANSLDYASMLDNMDAMRVEGLENDVPTGLYIQSIGRVDANGNPAGFRRTNAAEIRYEVNAALAYGYTQLSYFTWFTPTGRPETFTDAIIAPDGTPTDLYQPVSDLNAEVHALGPTLMDLDAAEVYLHGPDLFGQPAIPDGFIARFADDDNVIVSRMVDSETGRQYLMVVNNDFTAEQQVELRLRGGVRDLEVISREDGSSQPLFARNGRFALDLAAGDAVLLALPDDLRYVAPAPAVPLNLAANADVTAASSEGANGWYLDKLTDGERFSTPSSQGWRATEIVEGEPSTLTLDLRAERRFNRVDLYPAGGVFGYGLAFPETATVQVSTDGLQWRTVAEADLEPPTASVPVPSITFRSVRAQYVRVVIGEHSTRTGAAALELAEVEVYSDDGSLPAPEAFDDTVAETPWYEGKDLAQARPVGVSSSTEAAQWGWSSTFVNDGQFGPTATTNGWTSQVGTNTSPTDSEWVAVYLGGPYAVEEVVIHPRNAATDQANAGRGFPTDYRIETSVDGVTWTVVAEVADDVAVSAEPRTITLETPTTAAYLRVVGTELKLAQPAADGYLMQLGEVQVYGTPA